MSEIKYPYLPPGRIIEHVPADNFYIRFAREYARLHSLDKTMPNASVVVLGGRIIAAGANGSLYHEQSGCERVRLGCQSGQGYDLCEGCHPKNHGEATALRHAAERGVDVCGADLYMWGHYWCCQPCWDAMIAAGLRRVILLDRSWVLFDRASPGNIVGHQLD